MLMIISAKLQAQKWLPGHFTDVKGNVEAGFDDIIKVYVAGSGTGGGGGGGKRGVGFEPGISTGIGTGGYGAGIGGGISIPIGGGGGAEYEKTSWYYGENTAEMKHITNENFEDVMSDIMGDYPEVVEKIHAKVYMLANIDRLIVYFKQVQAAKK